MGTMPTLYGSIKSDVWNSDFGKWFGGRTRRLNTFRIWDVSEMASRLATVEIYRSSHWLTKKWPTVYREEATAVVYSTSAGMKPIADIRFAVSSDSPMFVFVPSFRYLHCGRA